MGKVRDMYPKLDFSQGLYDSKPKEGRPVEIDPRSLWALCGTICRLTELYVVRNKMGLALYVRAQTVKPHDLYNHYNVEVSKPKN